MQEIIVLSIAAVALIYLIYQVIMKKSGHDCDKCDYNKTDSKKK